MRILNSKSPRLNEVCIFIISMKCIQVEAPFSATLPFTRNKHDLFSGTVVPWSSRTPKGKSMV
jgi:hypothetical protein